MTASAPHSSDARSASAASLPLAELLFHAAKAVAADRCAHRVHAETGSGVLVNLGGDLTTAGPTPDGGWQVLVQDSDDDPPCSITLGSGTGLATSSTRRRQGLPS